MRRRFAIALEYTVSGPAPGSDQKDQSERTEVRQTLLISSPIDP